MNQESRIDTIIKNVLAESQGGYRRLQVPEIVPADIINHLLPEYPAIHVDEVAGIDGDNKKYEVSGIGDAKLKPIEVKQVKLKPVDNKYYVIDDVVDTYPAAI